MKTKKQENKTMAEILRMQNPTPETQRRKKEILELIRKGKSKSKISDHLQEKYEISECQAYKLIHDALIDLQNASEKIDIADIKAAYVERITSWIEDAIDRQDYKTAAKFQEMLHKLHQMYVEKQQLDVNVKNMEFKFGDE